MPWTLRDIKDETSLVNELYKIFIENTRLTHSKSAKVEFIITAGYLESYLKPGSRIIDIGAGAGEYSLYQADKGYQVDAVELTDWNIEYFKSKIRPGMKVSLSQGNALE